MIIMISIYAAVAGILGLVACDVPARLIREIKVQNILAWLEREISPIAKAELAR